MASVIVRDHLDRLGAKKYQEIASALKCRLRRCTRPSSSLRPWIPKPGRAYSEEAVNYVLPEIVVQKVDASTS